MMKTLKLFLAALALIVSFAAPLSQTVSAQASKEEACKGLGGNFNGGECTVSGDEPDIETVIARFIQVMSAIAGVAAVIMIIISGFRFITANGDAGTVAAARRTLIYALVGVVIVAISQTIVWFILRSTTG
jgi:energy-converting hydrogenase Eha subunit B